MAAYYVKLQDAYISESSVAFGTWKTIGYTMKTTTVFHYYEGAKGASEGGLVMPEPPRSLILPQMYGQLLQSQV